MDQPGQRPSAETDYLSENQLRAMLEAREQEKDAQLRQLRRRTNRVLLFSVLGLIAVSTFVSLFVEWRRAKYPEDYKTVPLTSQLGIKQEDTHFAKELFHFVVPDKKKETPEEAVPPAGK